jgi:hypothetical protein
MEKSSQNNPQFESTFADLSYAHLKERAPKLLDYMVGFQVLDKNEDETRAAGVFGFKVGRQWFYAPMFYMGGELKGSQLLYIKNTDSFVPLEENWVNYLINRKPVELGNAEQVPLGMLGVRAPEFSVYHDSPLTGYNKYASAMFHKPFTHAAFDPARQDEVHNKAAHYGESFDLRPVWGLVNVSPKSAVYSRLTDNLDLNQVLTEKAASASLVATLRDDPDFAAAFNKFYDRSVFGEEKVAAVEVRPPSDEQLKSAGLTRTAFKFYAGKLLKSAAVGDSPELAKTVYVLRKSGVSNMHRLREVFDRVTSEPVVTKVAAPVYPKPEVLRYDRDEDTRKVMSDDEKSELVEDGIVVRNISSSDEPGGHAGWDWSNASTVVNTELPKQLTNPTFSGMYDMLLKDGTFARVFVSEHPITIGTGHANCVTVVKSDGSDWFHAGPSRVMVQPANDTDDWSSFYDKATALSDMKVGECYIAIGPKGESTIPFEVVERDGNDVWVDAKAHVDYDLSKTVDYLDRERACEPTIRRQSNNTRADINHEHQTEDISPVRETRDGLSEERKLELAKLSVRKLCISDRTACLRNVGNMLLVPHEHKVVKLSKDFDKLMPGNANDFYVSMMKSGFSTISLSTDNGRYSIHYGDDGSYSRASKLDMVEHLVTDHGVTKAAAFSMIKSADTRGDASFFIKEAQSPQHQQFYHTDAGMFPGPGSPSTAMLDNTTTYSPEIGAPVQFPETEYETVSEMPLGDESIYEPLDYQTRETANRAAESGQKELFDTAVVSGLVKATDVDSMIDKYLSDLVLGLDRVGRLLFLFYWHHEKFKDRYGESELQELEDSFKNTFEGIGDLVLFLKKKTIEPDMAMTGSDVELD